MAKRKKSTSKQKAPDWATEPWGEYVRHAARLMQLLQLSVEGISAIQAMPRLVEVLAKGDDSEEAKNKIESARKAADLANREVDEGFPLLHAQTTIALWSALEAAFRVFMASWLQNHEPAMGIEAIQKLRVRIGEYENLEGEYRYLYILERLEQEMSLPLKSGVTRFESLLALFGLSGSIDEDSRRALFELNQVRNNLVHRSGVADKRLIDSCPWLGLKIGEVVELGDDATKRYFRATYRYSVEMIARSGEYFGADMAEYRAILDEDDIGLFED